jgi:menaquinol-cytochrome c reductase cytochrome b/c subunit
MKSICIFAILALLVAIPLSLWAAENGAELFASKCSGCHGEKGEGKGAALPAVKGTKKTDKQIVDFLLKGETGKTMHAGAFSDVNEEQAKAIAAFIKSLK